MRLSFRKPKLPTLSGRRKTQVSLAMVLMVMGYLGLEEHIPEELWRPVAEFVTTLINFAMEALCQ